MLKVKFINIVTVGAIALATATAAPARADSDGEKIVKLLLGVAAIAAIANATNKDRHHVAHTPPKRAKVIHRVQPPKTCLRKRYTRNGWKTFYSRKCLNKHQYRHNTRHVHNAPQPKHSHNKNRRHAPIY